MRHNRHIAALLCAAILMLFPAGCGEEQTARSPDDTLDSLIEQLTFSDQMTEMNADDACRFYNIDAELITGGRSSRRPNHGRRAADLSRRMDRRVFRLRPGRGPQAGKRDLATRGRVCHPLRFRR